MRGKLLMVIFVVLYFIPLTFAQVSRSIPACFDTDLKNLTTVGTCTSGNSTFQDYCLPSNFTLINSTILLPAGTYSFTVIPDFQHKIYEQFERNGSQIFFIVRGPNLRLLNLDVNVSNIDSGSANGTSILSATIVNTGNSSSSNTSNQTTDLQSPPFEITFNITDTQNATIFSAITLNFPPLSSLQNVTANATFQLPAGNYIATAIVDKKRIVQEESELDNSKTQTFLVAGPDLTVSSVVAKSAGNASDVSNATLFVNTTIITASTQPNWMARNSTTRFDIFDRSNQTPVLSFDVFTPSITGGQNYTVQFNTSLPAGEYEVYSYADYYNVIREVRENDNRNQFITRIVVYGPDLLFIQTSFNATTATMNTNASVFLNATIFNNGSTATNTTVVTFTLRDNFNRTPTQEVNMSVGPLAPYTNLTLSVVMSIPAGQYDWLVIADSSYRVREERELNNVVKRLVPVLGPDLSASDISVLAITNSTGIQNGSLTVKATIVSNLSGATGNATVTFWAIDRANLSLPFSTDVNLSGMNGGSNTTLNATFDIPAGQYNTYVIVDSKNNIVEANELNNILSINGPIFISGPDYVSSSIVVSILSNASVSRNASVNVSVNIAGIKNTSAWYGTQTMTQFKLLDMGNTTPDNVVTFDSLNVNTSPVNNNENRTISAILDAPPGRYKVVAIADSSNLLHELYEDNNNATSAVFVVPGPELIVDNLSVKIDGFANLSTNASAFLSTKIVNKGTSRSGPTNVLFNVTNEEGTLVYMYKTKIEDLEEKAEKMVEFFCGAGACKREVVSCTDEGYSYCSMGRCVNRIDLLPKSAVFYSISNSGSIVTGNLSVVIRNNGDSIAGQTLTEINVSGDIRLLPTPILQPDEEVTIQETYNLQPGNYTSEIIADKTDTNDEVNESNNVIYYNFTIVPLNLYRRNITVVNRISQSLPAGYVINFTFDHAAAVAAGKSTANGNDVRILFAGQEIDRVNITPFASNISRIEFRTQQLISGLSNDTQYALLYASADTGLPLSDWTHIYNMSADGSFTTNQGWTIQGPDVAISNGSARFTSLSRNVNEWIYTTISPPNNFKVSWKHFISSAGSASAVCMGSPGGVIASCASSARAANKDNATEFHHAVSGGGKQFTRNILWENGGSVQNETQDNFVGTEYRCTQIFYNGNLTFTCDGKSFGMPLLRSNGITLSNLFAVQSYNDGFGGQISGWVDDLRISPYVTPEPNALLNTEEKI